MSFTVVKDSYPNIVKDGLVLNVDAGSRLSYSGSGTTWSDISGNGNNGTLTNGPTYSSANSGSIVFDGTNDWVNLGTATSLGFSSVRTISCWVNTLTTGTYILGLWDLVVGVNQRTFGLYVDASTSTFASIWSPDGVNDPAVLYDTTNVQLNTWYNLVCIFRSGVRELWKNGVLVSSLSQAAIYTSASTSRLGFGALPGRSSDTPVAFFNGRGASVQLYNRALSAEEILQNYNALLPRFYSIVTSGLVLNLDAGNPNSYSPPRSDQYASSLVLAVPMNGANNGTTFTDESATIRGSGTAKAITRNGDTKTLTAQSKFYGSSGFFDGTGDYLSCSDSDDWHFSSGNFTAECWAYPTGSPNQPILVGQWDGVGGGTGLSWVMILSNNSSRYLRGLISSTGSGVDFDLVSSTSLGLNQWNHCAFVRNGSTFTLYLNGVSVASTTNSNALFNATNSLTVGASSNGSQPLNGYLQDLRVYKGVAKYTTNFKPPSISSGVTISSASGGVPILNTTDDYGTVNGSSGTTWTDISGNGNNGTLQGSPIATYSGANYGSFVFNGTNNEVTTTTQFTNPQTFSIGAWFKTSTASGNKIIGFENAQTGTGSFQFDRHIWIGTDGKLNFGIYSGGIVIATSPLTYADNTWHYVIATYGGEGTTMRLYVDGVSVATNTANAPAYNGYWRIGAYQSWGGTGYFPGSISLAQVYNRGITAAEISQNFNATKWRYGI